jgi:2-polyprenyl-6-methoxyphenol hydroxylase-like FAD-dependent oxidoreductase
MNTHGVVIGGGIGGLLAAYALAAHFDRVTVLERDVYPDAVGDAPPSRRGAPQSRCIHLLKAAGCAAFDELVPGWREEALARGAIPFDVSADAMARVSAGWLPRTPCGIMTFACSRALIEGVLRDGFAGSANVTIRQGRRVAGLISRQSGRCVSGLQLAGGQGDIASALQADLVVDASGAGSALRRWLARLPSGWGSQVETTVIGSGMEYVSRWFHLEPSNAPDWRALSLAPDSSGRAAMMLRAERNRWGIVLAVRAGDQLPAEDAEFTNFAAGLGDGVLRNALSRARAVSPMHRYRSIANRMTHYDRLESWPIGLVALGDSVCAMDPYFGLGMTAAARGATLLDVCLRETGGIPSTLEFQRRLAALNIEPWRLATGRSSDGRPSREAAEARRLYAAAPSNPMVAQALLSVSHMLRATDSLRELERS